MPKKNTRPTTETTTETREDELIVVFLPGEYPTEEDLDWSDPEEKDVPAEFSLKVNSRVTSLRIVIATRRLIQLLVTLGVGGGLIAILQYIIW